ncbi:MAG: hypothetical protein MI755_01915 [Sphingomonadales bacterium]|nr:hypothetical protein [Sphingomonadales bacterium]
MFGAFFRNLVDRIGGESTNPYSFFEVLADHGYFEGRNARLVSGMRVVDGATPRLANDNVAPAAGVEPRHAA